MPTPGRESNCTFALPVLRREPSSCEAALGGFVRVPGRMLQLRDYWRIGERETSESELDEKLEVIEFGFGQG